jgi:hypothetical protein
MARPHRAPQCLHARRAWLAALLLPLVPACKSKPSGAALPRVVSLDIVDRSPRPLLDSKGIGDKVAEVLRGSGAFEVLPRGSDKLLADGQREWRCQVTIAVGADPGDETVVHGMSQVDCHPKGDSGAEALTARALADLPASGASVTGRAKELGGRLARDTASLVVKQQKLRTGPLAELMAALKDPDADVRRQGVRAAAYRRAREAVPQLVAMMDEPQADLADMALGALVDIGDPSAVKALTARVKFGDVDELRKLIDPIAAMGGDEARAFLEFVASGHEDADIRKMAKTALERMERRAQATAAGRAQRR